MHGQEATTRERVLDAAARLFHEQGYHATGISTILREADVNAGSLYHFFPSKEAVLVGVLERYLAMCHPVVMAPVEAKTTNPIERVFALLQQYRDWLAPINFSMGCPIGNLALELSDGHHDIRRLVNANFDNWANFVEGWLEAAGDSLPSSVDRKRLASMVLTIMEGGLMQARAACSPEPFDQAVAQLRQYFDLLIEQARRERVEKPDGKPGGKPVGARTTSGNRAAKRRAGKKGAA